jgi:hypothetical protein
VASHNLPSLQTGPLAQCGCRCSLCVYTLSSGRLIAGVLICLVALLTGCTIGMAMGGFGICAVSFSLGLLGSSVVVAALFAGSVAFLWPKARWAGALAFSLPTTLGAAFGAASGAWERVVGIGVCIVASVFVAFVVRYPGPSSLKK